MKGFLITQREDTLNWVQLSCTHHSLLIICQQEYALVLLVGSFAGVCACVAYYFTSKKHDVSFYRMSPVASSVAAPALEPQTSINCPFIAVLNVYVDV